MRESLGQTVQWETIKNSCLVMEEVLKEGMQINILMQKCCQPPHSTRLKKKMFVELSAFSGGKKINNIIIVECIIIVEMHHAQWHFPVLAQNSNTVPPQVLWALVLHHMDPWFHKYVQGILWEADLTLLSSSEVEGIFPEWKNKKWTNRNYLHL